MECESMCAKLLLRIQKGVGAANTSRSRQVSPTGPGYRTEGAESGFGKHMSIRSAPCEASPIGAELLT